MKSDLITTEIQHIISYDSVDLNSSYIAGFGPIRKKRIRPLLNIREMYVHNYTVSLHHEGLQMIFHISGAKNTRVALTTFIAVAKIIYPGSKIRITKFEAI